MALNKNVAVTDSGTGYQYKPPVVNKKQEEEWTKQSLAKQAAEKVENQNSVAPPPKTTPAPIVSNPTYTNPVGASDALSRSESKINPVNPYVVPKSPFIGNYGLPQDQSPTVQEYQYNWQHPSSGIVGNVPTVNKPIYNYGLPQDQSPTVQDYYYNLQHPSSGIVKHDSRGYTPPRQPGGSLPPEGAGNFAPTTTQPATQDDLLSAALAAQKSPYQGAGASGELAGAISTPTGTTSPTTPSDSPGKGTQIRTKIEGQPWNNGWKLPWKQGGYTEEELILAGNNYVGKYDNKAQYELRGKNQYEGYYLAPNGNYYPVNQNKAEYAISRGAANLSQSKFNSPEYMDYYYDGYSSDVDDFVRAFGTENLWRYDPNWKNAGLKYSNPTSWNTGSGSSGNGASGNLGNNQQDGRGWYFNPAVNWAT